MWKNLVAKKSGHMISMYNPLTPTTVRVQKFPVHNVIMYTVQLNCRVLQQYSVLKNACTHTEKSRVLMCPWG